MAEKKSKEKKQDELVKKQGDAYVASYNLHVEELEHTVKKYDDYIITLAFGPIEGMYVMKSDKNLEWAVPKGASNLHLELLVQDRDDRRFVPYLNVYVKVYDSDENLVTETDAPFIWHPFLFHYGSDITIPDDGDYTVDVTIQRPDFNRYRKDHGKRYAEDINIKLGPIHLNLPGSDNDSEVLQP